MPLAEEPLALLAAALRDPKVVLRYMTVPGSDCLLVARRGVRHPMGLDVKLLLVGRAGSMQWLRRRGCAF